MDELKMKSSSGSTLSGAMALGACSAMSILYVGILYTPRLLLRLPAPKTMNSFLIRRFICAAVASLISLISSALVLGVRSFEAMPSVFTMYGIRLDRMWRAVLLPTLLTSLVYAGSLVSKAVVIHSSSQTETCSIWGLLETSRQDIRQRMQDIGSNMQFWRNYFVAPVTEEIVFRACMIPLLLCAGFKNTNILFFSPIFFSLAHLNHLWELYFERGCDFLRALTIVGFQLGYTVIFGAYAAFLFLRTGNLICPIVAHILCNMMGLPAFSSAHAKGLTRATFVLGVACFSLLLFPLTSPKLYNESPQECHCWNGQCSWD
ncbi:farnesylated protein-converting enzyme 2 isoform X1 [Wolffia australiana]